MRNYAFPALISACLALTACVAAEGGGGVDAQPPPAPSQAIAAQQGLAALQQLVTPQNYAGLGFSSLDDVRRAQLASPMPVFRVELDALMSMTPQTSPSTLLVDGRRVLYPVVVDQRVATALFVARHDDGWRTTDFGSAAV